MVRTRVDYPSDPILRDEIAYQIRLLREFGMQPSVLNAIRDLGKAAKAGEQARETHEWAARAFREPVPAGVPENELRAMWGDR
jgi:hypothetical protein